MPDDTHVYCAANVAQLLSNLRDAAELLQAARFDSIETRCRALTVAGSLAGTYGYLLNAVVRPVRLELTEAPAPAAIQGTTA